MALLKKQELVCLHRLSDTAVNFFLVLQVTCELQLTQNRRGQLHLGAHALADVQSAGPTGTGGERTTTPSSIKSNPVNRIQILGEHLLTPHMVHLEALD